tara:strand:- start:44 stop:238 length:195 start_codon:yes stop_codon:yes gene_type:complete
MKRGNLINKERVLQSIILESNLALRNLNQLTDENVEDLLHCESVIKKATSALSWKQGEPLNKTK